MDETGCEQCWTLLDRADDLLMRAAGKLANCEERSRTYEEQSQEHERIVVETAEAAVAEAVRPLLIEIAGLEAEREILAHQVLWWKVGTIVAAIAAVVALVVSALT